MADLNGRIKRLEQRLQPPEQRPQLVREDASRAIEGIIAALHDGIINPAEPPDVEELTDS